METPRLIRKCKARIHETLQDAGLDTPTREELYNQIKEKGKSEPEIHNLPTNTVKQEVVQDNEPVIIKQEEPEKSLIEIVSSDDDISDDIEDDDDDDKDPDFMMPSQIKKEKKTPVRSRRAKKAAQSPDDPDQPKTTKPKRVAKPRGPRKTKLKMEPETPTETTIKSEDGLLEDNSDVPKAKGRKRKAAEPKQGKPKAAKKLKLLKVPVSTGSGEYHDTVDWCIDEVLAYQMDIQLWVARNVIRLFEEDCTIPFIARYRKEMTDNMDAQKLRDVYDVFVTLKNVQAKALSIIAFIIKEGKMTPDLLSALKNATTMTELEHLYAPFKAGSKRTLAERAKKLGLEEPAMAILLYKPINLNLFIKPQTKGLTNIAEVCTGIQHIIADVISKDKIILEAIIKSAVNNQIYMEVSKSKSSNKEQAQKEKKETSSKKKEAENNKNTAHNHHKPDNEHKFELYYNFRLPAIRVRPHQTLAINRGEALKLLSVKLVVPEFIQYNISSLCKNKWMNGYRDDLHQQIVLTSIDDAYKRLLEPLLCRHIRSELTKTAEKESIAVFATNLQQLLLTPPLRGKTVLGIDPGFRNGCKMAVTSPTGEILHTDVFYLPKHNDLNDFSCKKLNGILRNFNCETIGIGNGTACRETETFISSLIQQNFFHPLDVVYCIVNECGASIYSVTEDAAKEMPSLDPNVRSAVSIARRLQDPLAEYVKIEPKHLGVGMYQHDMPENALKTALDSVVIECVSFVGVDLNSVSEVLLRKIAGLNATRAKNIIAWRTQNGCFRNREQLKQVKGIGPKSYEQCAGFIRIIHVNINNVDLKNVEPEASSSKGRKKKSDNSNKINPLDMTCIHPESYDVASRILEAADGQFNEIGYPSLFFKIQHLLRAKSIEDLAKEFQVGIPTMQLILDGLQKPYNYDMRSEFEKPLFRKGITSVDDLKIGTKVSGRVQNIVHFGAFVDIGVGKNGLIHNSKMPPHVLKGRTLKLGDKVEVTVLSVDISKARIGLLLEELL